MPTRPADERKKDFGEVALGFTPEQARAEAARCLECGCHDYGHCKLIKYANEYPIHPERLGSEKHPYFVEERLEAIERNQGKCILCGLCVRVWRRGCKAGYSRSCGSQVYNGYKTEFRIPRQ